MTAIPAPSKTPFHISQLVYDTRYRSTTIQVIVLLLFLLFLAWLASNTMSNLAERDKDINFSFIFQRAGYDINQQLIPYSSDSTHGRAIVIGLLNTISAAVAASFLATVLGVLVGVLRLSKNWLVSRLMTIYIEVFRNVPLLLWIVLAFVILGETRPQPRDFKVTEEMLANGQPAKATMWFWDSVAVTNRATNIPGPLLERPLGSIDILGIPANLSLLAAVTVLILSTLAARRLILRTRTLQEATGVRRTIWWKILLIVLAPFTGLLAAMGFHLDYPVLQGFNFQGGLAVAHAFTALVIALTLYSATYIAEAVRAGVMAISRGQSEAAFALGIRPGRTMQLVVLPQALRVIVPPLISQYLNIIKNTTLGMAISYLDLKGTLGGISLMQTGRELECMMLMMLIYLVISLIISAILNAYNQTVQLAGR
jgi:general L-amino acid transport system permease protein